MAFTKINAAGIGTTQTVTVDGLTVINDGSFGGNLTVSGVLTYEDVTNVDSIGIITARAGVLVGSGITLSKDGEIFATGISTIGVINSDKISLGDSEYIHIVIGSDLKIQHDSNNSIISNSTGELLIDSPIHNFRDTSNTSKAYIGSDGKIKLGSGGAPVGAAKVEIRYADPVLLVRDTASTSAVSDAKIGFGNESHYPVAFMSHVWDGTNGALTFHTRLSGSESEKVRIQSTGVVNIGDTTATSVSDRLLQIGKTDRSNTYVEVRTSTSGAGGIVFSDGTANDNTGYRGTVEYIHSSDYMMFKTAATERFRIGSSGQLGIGGATYGSSGQVFTSGGSGSAPSWTTITGTTINGNVDSQIVTATGTANTLQGESTFTFNGTTLHLTPSDAKVLISGASPHSVGGGNSKIQVQATDSTGRISVVQHRNEASGSPFITLESQEEPLLVLLLFYKMMTRQEH